MDIKHIKKRVDKCELCCVIYCNKCKDNDSESEEAYGYECNECVKIKIDHHIKEGPRTIDLERRKLVERYKDKIRKEIEILENKIYELDVQLRSANVRNIINRIK